MAQKIYPADQSKIAANHAKAGERRIWNENVVATKARRDTESSYFFIPRKPSHKQGYKLSPF